MGNVRIIGGQWRGSKLPVRNREGLRPTPDRVKETLFNWLQPYIAGSRCLDLFAGTGALGFEAVSRGAASSILIEDDDELYQELLNNIHRFYATNVKVIKANALDWLRQNQKQFDLVFLDPPFDSELIGDCCDLIHTTNCLAEAGLLYIESVPAFKPPPFLEIIKQGKAGQVMYLLARLV